MDTVLVSIPCEPSELAGVRHRLRRWLDGRDVRPDLRDAFVLAAHEAAANAIEHADPCDSLDICASIEARVLTVEVRDTGQWDDSPPEDEEGGRGLILIKQLIEHVEINPSPYGTIVRFRQSI